MTINESNWHYEVKKKLVEIGNELSEIGIYAEEEFKFGRFRADVVWKMELSLFGSITLVAIEIEKLEEDLSPLLYDVAKLRLLQPALILVVTDSELNNSDKESIRIIANPFKVKFIVCSDPYHLFSLETINIVYPKQYLKQFTILLHSLEYKHLQNLFRSSKIRKNEVEKYQDLEENGIVDIISENSNPFFPYSCALTAKGKELFNALNFIEKKLNTISDNYQKMEMNTNFLDTLNKLLNEINAISNLLKSDLKASDMDKLYSKKDLLIFLIAIGVIECNINKNWDKVIKDF